MQFSTLSLSPPVLRALVDEGYETPTPIQARAIQPILEGRDLLGCAQTGTGKTAAFALPILSRLAAAPVDKSRRGPALPRVLVLAPTRELAVQICESFAAYGRHTHLTHTTIYGGVSQVHQERALRKGVDIIVATPGRLMDLMEQRIVNLSAIKVLVLDEADQMLDMGFIQPIRRIAATLPADRQTVMFSATMPREILKLADSLLRDPVKISVAAPTTAPVLIEQSVYMVPRGIKQSLLEHLLQPKSVARAIVFTKTKHGADRVCHNLMRAGISADAIHGNRAQSQRRRTLDGFRSGRCRVLVATDVAARGLDVDGITHVFNFDLPLEAEGYVHRIGRTGRAGAGGIAISFCDHEERGLLRGIERLMGSPIKAVMQLPALAAHSPARPPAGTAQSGPSHSHRASDSLHSSVNHTRSGTPSSRPGTGHTHPRANRPHPRTGDSHPNAGHTHPKAGESHRGSGHAHPKVGHGHRGTANHRSDSTHSRPTAETRSGGANPNSKTTRQVARKALGTNSPRGH
ncbi:MAG: DEAD/DEAH box helicase [Phycisphaerales bacterium]